MKTLDLTLPTPEENLACDEALLDHCQDSGGPELLRFWQPDRHFVVLGYSRRAGEDVRLDACSKRGIPVLRRCSGGGTVLQGPGCLNYSLILRIEPGGPLRTIPRANAFILQRQQTLFQNLLGRPVGIQGDTDLVLDGRKFCGNAQRRKQGWLLFHGSVLLNLDLPLLEELLPIPDRQPAYRNSRPHSKFLLNLSRPGREVQNALERGWNGEGKFSSAPLGRIRKLAEERYSTLNLKSQL